MTELGAAADATFDAMKLSAQQRPRGRELEQRIELIAAHADAQRVAAVRAGRLDQERLREDYRAALARRAPGDATQPPDLLAALDRSTTAWTTGQCLLFDALLAEYTDEAGLAPPPPGLSTGSR